MTVGTSIDDGHIALELAEIAAWQMPQRLMPDFTVNPQNRPKCVARLPALQRGAVWRQAQVELLWDSILRSFPVGALVLSPVLRGQEVGRQGIHSETNSQSNLPEPTHHLLDGQQRAAAMTAGFYDPFSSGPEHEDSFRPILWLDIAPRSLRPIRKFLFRLTTLAHPWGFGDDDGSTPLRSESIRKALVAFGWREQEAGPNVKNIKDLAPCNGWPQRAGAAIPFAWLLQEATRPDATPIIFRQRLQNRCENVQLPWGARVATALADKATQLDKILIAVQEILRRKIIAFVVPDQALASGPNVKDQEISSAEHLFLRLNAGGTPPSQEDLSYSLIKAYWPEIERPIRDLTARRLPESRLFVLGARASMGMEQSNDSKLLLPGALSINQFRLLGLETSKSLIEAGPTEHGQIALSKAEQERKAERRVRAESIRRFFVGSDTAEIDPPIGKVVKKLTTWLELPAFKIPHILQSSIAHRSPETYLLLMWLARRCIMEQSTPSDDVARSITGIATALHWFPPKDPALASRLIVRRVVDQGICASDWLSLAFPNPGKSGEDCGLIRPLPPSQLESIIEQSDHHDLKKWRWHKVGLEQGVETNESRFIARVHKERELLMFAQRNYVNKQFLDFDPAEAITDQHHRPWDFDHILPSSKLAYKKSEPTRDGLAEWVNCIGNIRIWPREDNRSDQADNPKEKIATEMDIENSFLNRTEVAQFDQGSRDPFNDVAADAFKLATKARLLRIYSRWWEDLQIGHLFGPAK